MQKMAATIPVEASILRSTRVTSSDVAMDATNIPPRSAAATGMTTSLAGMDAFKIGSNNNGGQNCMGEY